MTSTASLLTRWNNMWLRIWSTPKSSARSKEFRDAGKSTSPNGIGGTKFSVRSTLLEWSRRIGKTRNGWELWTRSAKRERPSWRPWSKSTWGATDPANSRSTWWKRSILAATSSTLTKWRRGILTAARSKLGGPGRGSRWRRRSSWPRKRKPKRKRRQVNMERGAKQSKDEEKAFKIK